MLIFLILMPLLCAIVAFLPVRKIFRLWFLCAVSAVHAVIVGSFWVRLPQPELNSFLVLDPVGLILLSVVSFLFLSVSIYMIGYFDHEKRGDRALTACLFFLLSTMTLVSVSYHMGLLWVAIETTTLFSAPLISFHRNKQSLEATWKYLLVCSVGIALALLGTFFLAISAHASHTLLLPALLGGAGGLSINWLKLSIVFLVVGYGCKMGLAPTHSWKPEAYGQATGMVSVIMAGALTQCAFLALLRVSQISFKAGLNEFYASILIATAVLSLIVPAVFILGERNIKRAFAYSSIEHMGILVLGLSLGGPGIFGALFHMINNAIAKVVMFLTAGSVAQKYGSSRMGDVRGVIRTYPVTGIFLLVALLGGTGMFPFATFHSELMIISAAVMSGHYILSVAAVICLAFIFIGLGRIILEVVYGEASEPLLAKRENLMMNAAIAVSACLLIVLGLWMPGPLKNVIQAAVAMIKA